MTSTLLRATDRELILGGQRSGKSRTAELRARDWLAHGGEAVLIATARAGDGEMAERIARHRVDRAARAPGLETLEESAALARALAGQSRPGRLVVVDCLTLWLTQVAFPIGGEPASAAAIEQACDELVTALARAPGPVVLVSNEIGLGLIPMAPDVRRFVDALGHLHQGVAAACTRVTMMVAGCEWPVKRDAA